MTSRKAAHTAAIIGLLKSLPDDQLHDVLAGLDQRGVVQIAAPVDRPQRPCGVCGLGFHLCRRRWSHDHEYESPTPRKDTPA